jgi:hypothetical protein
MLERIGTTPTMPSEPRPKFDWPDLLLVGVGLLAEALALLYGASILTLGAATVFWFALRGYGRKKKPNARSLRFDIVSALALIAATTVLPIGIKTYVGHGNKSLNKSLLKAQIYGGNILYVWEPNHECKGYILHLSPDMDLDFNIASFSSVNLSIQFPEIVKEHRVDLFESSGGELSSVVYKENVGCRFAEPPHTLPANAYSNWDVATNTFTFKASPFDSILQAEFLTDESAPAPVGIFVRTPDELQKSGAYRYRRNDLLRDLEFDYPAKSGVLIFHAPVATKR